MNSTSSHYESAPMSQKELFCCIPIIMCSSRFINQNKLKVALLFCFIRDLFVISILVLGWPAPLCLYRCGCGFGSHQQFCFLSFELGKSLLGSGSTSFTLFKIFKVLVSINAYEINICYISWPVLRRSALKRYCRKPQC